MSEAGKAETTPTTTLGRYELVTSIGRGGMAEVHLALQRGPGGFEKLVVIKLIHEELASQPAVVEQLLAEAKHAALIKHPNVVDIYDLGEADGRHFIAMEYLEGEPLLSILEAGHGGKRLDALSTARLIADSAEGLEAAHSLKGRDGKPLGLVHHDVSPGNLFVLYTGQAKLLDFGVAKATRTTTSETIEGKSGYMAPEKLDGRSGDRRSDLWSLGCVLWEALTLKRLFRGDTEAETIRQVRYLKIAPPSQMNPEVPAELDAIVLKALHRDPTKRYQTAKELGDALEEVLRDRSYGAKSYKIAAYMQVTFAEHIAARERLLRELTGVESRASVEVIESAFGDSLMSTEPSPSADAYPDFGIDLPSAVVAVTALDDVVELGAPPPIPKPAVTPPPRPRAAPAPPRPSERQPVATPARPRTRIVPYVLAALAVIGVVIVVGVVAATRGDTDPPSSPALATPSAAPVEIAIDAAVAAAPAVIAEAPRPAEPAIEERVAVDTMVPEIEMEPAPPVVTPPRVRSKRRTRDAAPAPTTVEGLYRAGLDQLKRGDAKSALASLTRARAMNAGYAPVWYGLGLVNEKLGNSGAAKAAYQRYLSLAPRAANVQRVRDRLGRL